MLHRVSTAGFQNIVKAQHIGFYIGIGVSDAVAHTGLGGKIHHDLGSVALKEGENQLSVCDIPTDKLPSTGGLLLYQLCNATQAIFLEGDIVVVVHVIQTDNVDVFFGFQQAQDKVTANKACRSGNEDGFILKLLCHIIHRLSLEVRKGFAVGQG